MRHFSSFITCLSCSGLSRFIRLMNLIEVLTFLRAYLYMIYIILQNISITKTRNLSVHNQKNKSTESICFDLQTYHLIYIWKFRCLHFPIFLQNYIIPDNLHCVHFLHKIPNLQFPLSELLPDQIPSSFPV